MRPTLTLFLFLELLALALLFSIYGFNSSTILTVPASLFREGFHLNFLSLRKVDLFLLCLLGMANAVWICAAVMNMIGNKGHHCCTANEAQVRDAQTN